MVGSELLGQRGRICSNPGLHLETDQHDYSDLYQFPLGDLREASCPCLLAQARVIQLQRLDFDQVRHRRYQPAASRRQTG